MWLRTLGILFDVQVQCVYIIKFRKKTLLLLLLCLCVDVHDGSFQRYAGSQELPRSRQDI
jgi:hypothetical protein